MKPLLKCAEVFRYGPGKFIFICAYCDQQFDCNSTALSHTETHFQVNHIDVNKWENTQPVHIELQESSNSLAVRKKETFVLNIKNEASLDIIDIDQNERNTKDCSEMVYEIVHETNSPLAEHIEESVIDIQQEPRLNTDVGSFSFFISDLDSTNTELTNGKRLNYNTNHAPLPETSCAPTQSIPRTFNDLVMNKFKGLEWGPKIDLESIIECDVCGNNFQRRNALPHFKIHATKKKINGHWSPRRLQTAYIYRKFKWGPTILQSTYIECDICGIKVKKANSYSHFRTHTDRNKYQCPTCQRGFCSTTYLKKHMESHWTIKRFNCEICGRQFNTKYSLQTHIRTHTGEKPYKCSMCEKSFAQSSSLHIHLRFHTREKPFKCTLCDQSFITNSRWNDHIRRHNNLKQHKCAFCDLSFFKKRSRVEHERSQHTGERPFKCDVCGREFARQTNYKQHYFLHTGEKLYNCRVCDLTFAQGSSRRVHERSAHKDVANLIIESTNFRSPVTSTITTSLKLEKV